jgi:uncharacterized protein
LKLPDLDPVFLAAALFCVVITGISKSGLGGGLGQLSVPIMAVFISPVAAAAIMLPILCAIDLFNIWGYRKHFHRGNLIALVPGAVLGIGIGALTFRYIDENAVRLILGVLSLIFSLTYFLQQSPVKADSLWGRWFGAFCGTLAGFTSFVAHAGGGPVKIYLLPQRLDKKVFVGTQVFFFFIINQIKIWPYLWLGQFSTENLSTSLILMPAVPVGVWLGWRLIKVIAAETFYKICYALLFIAGIKLIHDGLLGIGWL